MSAEALDQFRSAMRGRGLIPPDGIVTDGEIHRCDAEGKGGKNDGAYLLHMDGIPAGGIENHRDGLGWESWRADIGRKLTVEEQRAIQQRQQAQAKANDERKAQQHADTARRAQAIWEACSRTVGDHAYLMRKVVEAHGARVFLQELTIGGMDCNGALVVPMRDSAGELRSLQFIAPDGGPDKRYLSGAKPEGIYYSIGTPGEILCICEGFATGASIAEATGYAVVVGFDTGGLVPVAKAMREKMPEARIILCADDDYRTATNPGMTKAKAAAQAVGGYLAIPDFGSDRPDGATDFNDLAAHRGAQAVLTCIEAAQQMRQEPQKPQLSQSQDNESSIGEWPVPVTLDRQAAPGETYPLDALPGSIGEAVREYLAYGQQPTSLMASSALAVVSVATQGLTDVARDERLMGPVSLNFMVIAQSGERKTAADRAFGAALADWEREREESMRDDILRSRAALDAWTAEDEGLKTALRSAVRKKPGEAKELRDRLQDHALDKPAVLVTPRLRYEDVNPQSLAYMLATGHPSAALWSDEGGMVTGSHGMGKDSLLGFLGSLNRLWDGGAIHHDRKQAPSVHVEGRRFTVSLMLQPAVLQEFGRRGDGLTRGSGFLARYLVSAPISTMGTRLYREPPHGMPHLTAFHRRIRELLDTALPLNDKGGLCPAVLRLSSGAASVWRAYHDEVERQLRPLGDYRDVCDFAAKSAENAARLAGCFHIFAGEAGAVSEATMHRAVRLARWHLKETMRVLDVLDEPQAWTDARLLDTWLASNGAPTTREVLQFGPNSLRDKKRRNAAIEVLKDLGRVRVEADGRREVLVQNPALRRVATATPATVATDGPGNGECVAEVATVAVADSQNPEVF